MLSEQPRMVGRYQVRGELGAGGFATVYRAYDPALDREVALKVLHPHLARNDLTRERFVREGRALARVRHGGVVQVFDTGEAGGSTYLAMELIEGRSLAAAMAGRGRASLAETLAIADQVGAALAAVHARNLVHRDVKPANILIEAETGRAVLLDLGVARALDAAATTTGWVLGTPAFMAPEQVQPGGHVTPRTDVYQLGATVYALLAGRHPFEGEPTQVMYAVIHLAPPDLGALRPDLPPAVAAVISEALAKDPDLRPEGPLVFASQLRAAASSAAPTPAGTTAWPAPTPAGSVSAALTAPAPRSVAADDALTPADHAPTPPTLVYRPVPVAPEPSSGEPHQAGHARRRALAALAGGVVLLGLLAAAGGAVLAGRRDRAPVVAGTAAQPETTAAIAAGTAEASATAAALPVVTDLKVYDNVFSLRENEFVVGESFVACFTLTPGRDGRPLSVLATAGSEPPRSLSDAPAVAQSALIAQREGAGCHPVPVRMSPLPPGDYRVWVVLPDAEVLARAGFRSLPVATPQPVAAAATPSPVPVAATAAPRPPVTQATAAAAATAAPVQPAATAVVTAEATATATPPPTPRPPAVGTPDTATTTPPPTPRPPAVGTAAP